MNLILKTALEKTYSRAISHKRPLLSTLAAFLGWQYKYHRVVDDRSEPTENIVSFMDKNIYNWFEQIVFVVPRLVKNILKLGTEFIWNLADGALSKLSKESFKTAQNTNSIISFMLYFLASLIFKALSLIPWMIAKIGQSITSPLAALEESFYFFKNKTILVFEDGALGLVLGVAAAIVRGLFSLSCYSAIAIFAAPFIATFFAGSSIAASLVTAANWLASLPIISNIGLYLATTASAFATAVGTSISVSLASASAIAVATLSAVLALTSLKTLLRYLSPFESKPEAEEATVDNNTTRILQSSNPNANNIQQPQANLNPSPAITAAYPNSRPGVANSSAFQYAGTVQQQTAPSLVQQDGNRMGAQSFNNS